MALAGLGKERIGFSRRRWCAREQDLAVPSLVFSSECPSKLRLLFPILRYYNVGRCFRRGKTNKQATAATAKKGKGRRIKLGEVDSGNIKSDLSQQRREWKGMVEGTWGLRKQPQQRERRKEASRAAARRVGTKIIKEKAETGVWPMSRARASRRGGRQAGGADGGEAVMRNRDR